MREEKTIMSKFDPWDYVCVSQNSDGSINRPPYASIAPPTGDVDDLPGQKAATKDIVLDPEKKTWVRIYCPTSDNLHTSPLPIIISFHGGGFIDFSVTDLINRQRSNDLCSEIPAIVVALEYRLAPEHRLPAAYQDAVDSILWVKKQAVDPTGEPWLKNYGDFSKCFLWGAKCGGNIAFHAGLRALDLNLEPLKIDGIIMNQPMFGGKERVKSELRYATDQIFPLPASDLCWELALPKGTDRDHRYSNPMLDGPYKEKVKRLGRCLVLGFGQSILVDRQQDFVQMLVMNGATVEARFDDVGFLGIDLVDKARGQAVLQFIKDFIWSSSRKINFDE